MQCFKQIQPSSLSYLAEDCTPTAAAAAVTPNFLLFENSNLQNCGSIYLQQEPHPSNSPANAAPAAGSNNCDNYTPVISPSCSTANTINNGNNSSPSPLSSSPYSSQMPHFGLGGGPGMANNAYAQTPPSPPLHHAGGGGGGNGGLMPPSPPHHPGHNPHQQQQQQQHHPHLAMIPRGMGNGGGGGGNGGGSIMSTGLNTSVSSISSATSFRSHIEEKKLTRDAMERYMRERNDMVIVILHAKVRN